MLVVGHVFSTLCLEFTLAVYMIANYTTLERFALEILKFSSSVLHVVYTLFITAVMLSCLLTECRH